MSWRLCAGGKRLQWEINHLYPLRDKSSDGTIGDASHAARGSASDHNPDKFGVVYAIDIDEDLYGVKFPDPKEANLLVARLVEIGKTDKRLKYIIFEGNIWSADHGWKKQPYTGVNSHQHHIHVSFTTAAALNARSFGLKKSPTRTI